jgi:hypothetical protein
MAFHWAPATHHHASAPGEQTTRPGRADSRAVVSISPPAAEAVRRMAEEMGGISNAEVVRRGLVLLDLLLSLEENEELGVYNRDTDGYDRIRFAWDAMRRRR